MKKSSKKGERGASDKKPSRSPASTGPNARAKGRRSNASDRSRRKLPKIGDRVRILNDHPWKPFRGQIKTVRQVIRKTHAGIYVGFDGGAVHEHSFHILPALGIGRAAEGRSVAQRRTGAKRTPAKPGASRTTPK